MVTMIAPAPTPSKHRPAVDCALIAHAVFPPPVTGMTACTQSVINAVASRAEVRRFNWSNGSPRISLRFRLIKAMRALTTPVRLLFGGRRGNAVFYMPANAGQAMFYNIAAMAAARLRGYRCVLHHHHFGYLDRYDWRMKLLTRVMGADSLHLMLCREMEQQFRRHYGRELSSAAVPSTIQLLDSGFAPPRISDPLAAGFSPFRLGHLTNLQLAKGLDLVIEVFRALCRQHRDIQLVLAGPIDTSVERRLIESAQQEFGRMIDYRGPVYGAAKRKFFDDIHVNVYPTRNDAQPLVVTETLAYGKPVLTFARGCIPGLIGSAGSWAVPPTDGFTDFAAREIAAWIGDPTTYADACHRARARYDALAEEAAEALENFTAWVCGESPAGFVKTG